jgi:hypothetical protein
LRSVFHDTQAWAIMRSRIETSSSSHPVVGCRVHVQPEALPGKAPEKAKTSAVAIVEFGVGDAAVCYVNHGRSVEGSRRETRDDVLCSDVVKAVGRRASWAERVMRDHWPDFCVSRRARACSCVAGSLSDRRQRVGKCRRRRVLVSLKVRYRRSAELSVERQAGSVSPGRRGGGRYCNSRDNPFSS